MRAPCYPHQSTSGPDLAGVLCHPIGPDMAVVHARVLPEPARDLERIHACSLPPCPLVAGAMDGAVMGAALTDGVGCLRDEGATVS